MDELDLLLQRVEELESIVDDFSNKLNNSFPKELYENKIEVLNKKIANLEDKNRVIHAEKESLLNELELYKQKNSKALEKVETLYKNILKIKENANS
jgi:uncharacterized coiled-coil DUF342 family protein